jgi:hypothetical protein
MQHKAKPFKAVITKETAQDTACFLAVDDIAPHTPLWTVERERKVPRTVDALVAVVAPLLRISSRILFIDRMYHPASERWRDVLAQMVKSACDDQVKFPALEYHCGIESDEFSKSEELRKADFKRECERYLLDIMPLRAAMTIIRWDRHHRGDFFHDRYVLTDRGGVRVGWGLDRGKTGETTDVCLLDDAIYVQLLSAFQPDSNVYKLIDTTTIER